MICRGVLGEDERTMNMTLTLRPRAIISRSANSHSFECQDQNQRMVRPMSAATRTKLVARREPSIEGWDRIRELLSMIRPLSRRQPSHSPITT